METQALPNRHPELTSPTKTARPVRLVGGMIEGPDLLTIRELAELFGVRRETLWSWRRHNGFPAGIVIGTTRRVPRGAVEEWIRAKAASAGAPARPARHPRPRG